MPLPGTVDSGVHQPSLFTSVRSFWRIFLASLHTRLDLLTTELQEEAFRVAYLVGAGIGLVLCLHAAFFFLMFGIIAALWYSGYVIYVIFGIFAIYLAIALGLFLYIRSVLVNRPPFLDQTLTELKRDVEGFQAAIKPVEKQS
jgi:uncharacterized membrane protein YqjE